MTDPVDRSDIPITFARSKSDHPGKAFRAVTGQPNAWLPRMRHDGCQQDEIPQTLPSSNMSVGAATPTFKSSPPATGIGIPFKASPSTGGTPGETSTIPSSTIFGDYPSAPSAVGQLPDTPRGRMLGQLREKTIQDSG